jgi:hypothetical protein
VEEASGEENRKLALMRFTLGSPCALEIEQSVADGLVRAMEIILEMVSVEQKFSIIMENFLEFEQEIASTVLRDAYFSSQSAQEFFDAKQAFNRRALNILTAVRLYHDQSHSHVRVIFPDEPERWGELKRAFSEEYDQYLSYRTMEALRNYAQHRGLPIQGLTMGSRWLDSQTPASRLEFNAATNIIISELESDSKFKKSVLEELRQVGGSKGVVDVRPMVREYIQSIASVHEKFRGMSDPLVEESLSLVEEWKGKYKKHCPSTEQSSIAVGWQYENRSRERIAYLNDEQISQLAILRGRTRSNVNLAKRFVTTAPYQR